MPRRKVPAPRAYDISAADRDAFRTRFWRCPVRLVADGTWSALWAGGDGRKRGGGGAGALLPVLALHVWPGQPGDTPGWTGSVVLSYRRLARLAGLDKDTVGGALGQLAALGLVAVEVRQIAEGDVRKVASVRVSVRAYAAPGERHVVFPAAFVYGGGWSRLPGAAERHLSIAWAAWAMARLTDPDAGPLPRTMPRIREALAQASGMGKTAVRSAVAALMEYETPGGDRLLRDAGGFVRPDFGGAAAVYEWPLAAESPEAHAEQQAARPAAPGEESTRVSVRSAKAAVGSAPVLVPALVLPPLEGPAAFQARKVWWIERYLARWAFRVLRRAWEPAENAVFVDLCPGSCEKGLTPALQAAATVARRMAWSWHVPLRIVAVAPDAECARRIRAACSAGVSEVLSVTDSPAELVLERYADEQGRALLTFLGAVDPEPPGRDLLRSTVSGRDRELVALSGGGTQETVGGRFWRLSAGVKREGGGPVERFARAAVSVGARTVLSTPIASCAGAPAGLVVHAAGTHGAVLAWKAAISSGRCNAEGGDERNDVLTAQRGFAIGETADWVARTFRGRTLPWSRADRRERTLRRQVLSRTPLLPSDLLSLRRELTGRGWLASRRPLAFRVPR